MCHRLLSEYRYVSQLDGESVHYLESFGSVYLFRRIENDLHCGDTSILDRLQGSLNLFHTNAIVKNLEVLQLHSFTVFSAAGEGM